MGAIIAWIVLGLIAGFIASKIVNKTGSGMIMDIVLGVVGAIVGGFIGNQIGMGPDRTYLELLEHHSRNRRRMHRAMGIPQVCSDDLSRQRSAALHRAADASSASLASTQPSTAPSARIRRFQNGARVFR